MSNRPMTVSDRIVIQASPDEVYALVSDPRRTRSYSPENTGARSDQPDATGAEGPAGPAGAAGSDAFTVGSTFVGTNRRGIARWSTRCTVTHAEPGERFAFRVHQFGLRTPRLEVPIATWDYTMRAVDGGTEVIETWTDGRTRWPDAAARAFDFVATGGATFARFQRRNIATTLRNLKQVLEG